MQAIKTFDASMTTPQELGRIPAPNVLQELYPINGVCIYKATWEQIADTETEIEPFALPAGEWVFAFGVCLNNFTSNDVTIHLGVTHADAIDYRVYWGDTEPGGPLLNNSTMLDNPQSVDILPGGKQLYISMTADNSGNAEAAFVFVTKEVAKLWGIKI